MISQGVYRILLVGENLELLRRRVGSLARAGAEIVISDPAELETHVGKESFDLVVLCHTLTDVLRRSVTESAHRRWPRVKVLQIFAQRGEVTSIGCPLDDRAPDIPDELLKHTTDLLSRIA